MKALVIAAVFLALSVQVAQGLCNHEDGNIPAWSGPNYAGVLYGEIAVCRDGTNVPTSVLQAGMDGWNEAAGKTLLVQNCGYYYVVVRDVDDGICGYDEFGTPNPACGDTPTVEGPELLRIRVATVFTNYTDAQQRHAFSHEMGHTLGFFHLSQCDSVMSILQCGYANPGPTPLDEANYYEAYTVEAVTSLQGWSSVPADAFLAWLQVNSQSELLCNEAGFSVTHNGAEVASVGKDVTAVDLSEQPYGPQTYTVKSLTGAIAGPQEETSTQVDVYGPKVKSLFLFGPAPSHLSDEQGRYMWGIGEIQNPEASSLPVVFRLSITGAASGCSQLIQLVLPGTEQQTLAPHEIVWVLYRVRYECHSPATPTVRTTTYGLCVRAAGVTVEDCHLDNRSLIVW